MRNFFRSSYEKLKSALGKTKGFLTERLKPLFQKGIGEETLEEMEEILFEADLGSSLALEFVEEVRSYAKHNQGYTPQDLLEHLKKKSLDILELTPIPSEEEGPGPIVYLIVGVNGSGKTTTIAKLAQRFKGEGKSVLIAAGDTFRAAAIEQLTSWSDRIGVEIVKSSLGADSASVAFDAIQKAKHLQSDVVLIDTAGRLQSKSHLMEELEKMVRTIKKCHPKAPHHTLLTIDANIGQNAMEQVEVFDKSAPLTGLILTKLDGTAKGGIVLSIYKQKRLPIHFVGVGESPDDLLLFDKEDYVNALF